MAPIRSLLLLSSMSVVLLWDTMLMNSTLDDVSLAAEEGVFPGGQPLRLLWTTIWL